MSSHTAVWRRRWLIYLATSVVVLAADFAYLNWREQSLEPLSASVDLSRPGTYTFIASGFHNSRYHPAFGLAIPFRTDFMNWFPSQDYSELWAGTPPEIELEIQDRSGFTVLKEMSALTRTDEWIVTGTGGVTWVEIYKFAEFEAEMFRSYRVRLAVLRGSAQATTYRPTFRIAAIKSYALLPATLGFLALVVIVLVAGVFLAVTHFLGHRRWKRRLHDQA